MHSMRTIIDRAVEIIPDTNARTSLQRYLTEPQTNEKIDTIEQFFHSLTESRITKEQTNVFCHNWSKIHLSSQSVSGLMVRLLNEAEKAQGFKRDNYFMAAAQMGHVIVEDTGVQGPSHHRMYETFAGTLTGSDSWKDTRLELPEIGTFREYVEKSRTREPLETGILTTFASEIINTAEYTYANQKIMPWMTKSQDIQPADARKAVAYIHIHAGETELDHAQHAFKAWKFYSTAERRQTNTENLVKIFDRYLSAASKAYSALNKGMLLSAVNQNKATDKYASLQKQSQNVYSWVMPTMG